MKSVIIYTDGACKGNPGPGGWGAIIMWDRDNLEELSGGSEYTTNNRMEMTAVIKSLEALGDISYEIDLFSDSSYVINAFVKGWLENWKENNWMRPESRYSKGGGPVKNADLWKKLDELVSKHKVHFHWVKGHAENKYNNRCDELAVAESNKL